MQIVSHHSTGLQVPEGLCVAGVAVSLCQLFEQLQERGRPDLGTDPEYAGLNAEFASEHLSIMVIIEMQVVRSSASRVISSSK